MAKELAGNFRNSIWRKIMNDIIKQLAEHAGFRFYDLYDDDNQRLGETIESDSWDAAEHLTGLIVLECVETLKMGNDVILIRRVVGHSRQCSNR